MITIDKDGWIKEAIGIYYPNRSWGPFTQKPRQIVIHGTATANATAQDIATNWANTDGDASAHIIINKDGTFVQGLSLRETAWANCCLTDNPNTGAQWDRRLPLGNQNYWSIAIEHCKYDPNYNSDVLTPEQQATSFALVKAICEYHGIPKQVIGIGDISQGGVIGHCTIDTLNRTYCPGPYSWQALSDYLQGGTAPMNPYQQQAAKDCWNSTATLFGGTPPRYDSGIAKAWLVEYGKGIFYGPPLTQEYHTINWEGKPIIAQEFAGGRCEWSNGAPDWFAR